MTTALLPCPFCGGGDLTYHQDISEDKPRRPYAWHVFCRNCHCHGRNNFPIGWAETTQAAADAWNKRHEETDRTDEVRFAYDVFREAKSVPPHIHPAWDDLEPWVREALAYAFGHGKILGMMER